jgi:hypothetical protein
MHMLHNPPLLAFFELPVRVDIYARSGTWLKLCISVMTRVLQWHSMHSSSDALASSQPLQDAKQLVQEHR